MIPNLIPPDSSKAFFEEIDEPFVDVAEYSKGKILVDMQYAKAGKKGAISIAYLRKKVADMLLAATECLPKGYAFKIYDAWRPFEVQKSLYDEYYEGLKKENPTFSEEELHRLAKNFVSFPDKGKRFAFVHSSGGAVDLTIVDENGVDLDMGTPFDDFTERSNTTALEKEDTLARKNRRLLYHALTGVGFTNYPFEWWHYDYGDIFWGAMTGEPVKYPSVYTKEEMILEKKEYGGTVKI